MGKRKPKTYRLENVGKTNCLGSEYESTTTAPKRKEKKIQKNLLKQDYEPVLDKIPERGFKKFQFLSKYGSLHRPNLDEVFRCDFHELHFSLF